MGVWREGTVSRNAQATQGRAAERPTASTHCTSRSWSRETRELATATCSRTLLGRTGQAKAARPRPGNPAPLGLEAPWPGVSESPQAMLLHPSGWGLPLPILCCSEPQLPLQTRGR